MADSDDLEFDDAALDELDAIVNQHATKTVRVRLQPIQAAHEPHHALAEALIWQTCC
jgi:hypothetical protein